MRRGRRRLEHRSHRLVGKQATVLTTKRRDIDGGAHSEVEAVANLAVHEALALEIRIAEEREHDRHPLGAGECGVTDGGGNVGPRWRSDRTRDRRPQILPLWHDAP